MRAAPCDPGPGSGRVATLFVFALLAVTLASAAPAAVAAVDPDESSLPREVVFPSDRGEVVFPHLMHLYDMEIPCEDCHHETAAGALDLPHPEYFNDFWIECESCHTVDSTTSGPQPCGSCHHSAPTDIADETLSAKVVVHQSCWECHPAGSGAEASATCDMCHRPLIEETA